MSGEQESTPPIEDQVQAKYNELYGRLDNRQNLLSLIPNSVSDSEVPKLLDVTRAELRGMSAEDAAESAALIQQASYAVQRWQNRCNAVAHWAEEAINIVVAEQTGNMVNFAFKDRRAAAIKANAVAMKINRLKIEAETLSKDVEYLAARLEHSGRVFENLSRVKLKQHG